jgi:hypothetical protein
MTRAQSQTAAAIIARCCAEGQPARETDRQLREALPQVSNRELDGAWVRATPKLQPAD